MSDIECPYCETDFDLNHDGPLYYQEDHGVETACPNCDKIFMVYGSCHWSWKGQEADCLNGAEHSWKDMHGAPAEYFKGRQRCSSCDEERKVANPHPLKVAEERTI